MGDWKAYLKTVHDYQNNGFDPHEWTGRAIGDEEIIENVERLLKRALTKEIGA